MSYKKIGILTILPRNNNYGGILQGYALMTYLKSLGFQPVLISRLKNRLSIKSRLKIFLKDIILKNNTPDLSSLISKNMRYFEDKYIQPRTENIQNNKEFSILKKYNFDAIIVGSDQVWRKAYNEDRKANFFLNFLIDNKTKRIAYAASFGVDSWDYSNCETKRYAKLLNRFDAVSVREDSGITLCENHLGVKPSLMIDPTFLLTKNDYLALVKNENEPKSNGELLYYILSPDTTKLQILETTTDFFKMQSFSVNRNSNDLKSPLIDLTYPTITAWLRGFQDAQFVVTDSFHGSVFSILFNIPFVVCSNSSAGNARFSTLLKTFGLGNRFIQSHDDLTTELLTEKINWGQVNSILENKRKEALNFLISSIEA